MKMDYDAVEEALKRYGYLPEIAGEEAFSQAVRVIMKAQALNRGVLVNGECGVGKTTFCDAAALILAQGNNVYEFELADPMSAMKLADSEANMKAHGGFVKLDDLGSENILNEYGTRRDYVGELICAYHSTWSMAKRRPVMFVSTNLTVPKLLARYAARVVERLMELTVAWTMPGESKRDFEVVGDFK